MQIILWILCAVIGYLLGNISTGTIIANRAKGIDIRKYGSGSSGATNMLRVLGKKHAALTFAGDFIKGLIATLLGLWIGGQNGAMLAGLFSVVGHIWPAFYGFKGGKGVTTSLAVILVLSPAHALIVAVVAIGIMAITKYVSLGDILAALTYGLLSLFTAWGTNWPHVVFGVALAALVIYAHRGNIQRLLKGTENKLGTKKK